MYTMRVVIIFVALQSCLCDLKGPNVCTKQEVYTHKVNVTHLVPYTVRDYVWCANIPPRCSRHIVKHKIVEKEQYLYKFKPVTDCCKGYRKNEDETECKATCSNCVHGTCIEPNKCSCESGYGGPSCEISCPINLWGNKCQHDCLCKNNSTCDASNGHCSCPDGWRGTHCEVKCRPGTFGKRCLQRCNCNEGYCDHVSGQCLCSKIDSKELCAAEDRVEIQCNCENGGSCYGKSNACLCKDGWEGEMCQRSCNAGFWGRNCSNTCECFNDADCHHVSGKCICKPGFTGDRCRSICPRGTYGMDCNGMCKCQNGGICSNIDGTCACLEKWIGTICDTNICSYVNGQQICLDIFPIGDCNLYCRIEPEPLAVSSNACICPHENFTCNAFNKCVCKEGFHCTTTNNYTLLILCGTALGLFIIIALPILAVILIKAKQRTISSEQRLNLQLYNRRVEERDGLNDHYLQLHQFANHHIYETVREREVQYNSLIFGNPINPKNLRYQQVGNSESAQYEIPITIKYKDNSNLGILS